MATPDSGSANARPSRGAAQAGRAHRAASARAGQRPVERAAVVAALVSAGLAVAAHVLGKAVRDALYLATFPVERLPYFVLGTGVLSGVAVSVYTRLNAARSPRRVVPALAAFAALLSPPFYLAVRSGSAVAVALLYGFTTISGALLVSGFWAVLGERFDPRAARHLLGLVGAAATVGGLVGGLGAHALLRGLDAEALLLPLAGLELLMALAIAKLARRSERGPGGPAARPAEKAPEAGLRRGVREILGSPYLRDVALLVTALTVAGTLADYMLKDAAARSLHGKRELAEFFSLFHGAVGAATLGVQVFVCRPLVARKGLSAALVALPIWLALGAAAVIAAPVVWAATALRGGENAVRNSFHRAGYELLFVPVAPAQKRVVKPILDTLLDRVADAIGAGLVLLLIAVIGLRLPALGWATLALAAASAYLVARVRRGYVATLSARLELLGLADEERARDVELQEMVRAAGDDATTRAVLRTTLLDARRDELRQSLTKSKLGLSLMRSLQMEVPEALARARPHQKPAAAPPPLAIEDPALSLIRQLGDPDPAAARDAIARWDGRDKRAVPFLARLLGRDDVMKDAAAALSRAGDRVAGALADHLADPDEDFAVRRRIPRVLSACWSPIAIEALVRGLSDRRFEVRFHCAAALQRIQAAGGPRAAPEPIWAVIREEVRKSRSMWEAQRLLEEPEEDDEAGGGAGAGAAIPPSIAGAVEQRGAHSLRHVFRLLGLALDARAIDLSYRALGTGDAQFRGVGLEYLENVLPPDVRQALWPFIGDDAEPPPLSRSGRALAEVMKELAATGSRAAGRATLASEKA